ncbi:hypothetical protein HDU89_002278 [Geranomyces variabilis]|nr:hypothetical protein HDU89_002278 [Geranomyces variabilis]
MFLSPPSTFHLAPREAPSTNMTMAPEDDCAPLVGPNFDPANPEFQRLVIALQITVVLATISISASFYLIFRHLQHYTQPQYQRWIVRILFMVPIYAFASCLTFRFYWLAPYIDVVRDSYEAFALYSFHRLLLLYLGPDLEGQHARMQGKKVKRFPLPFCCWWYNPAGYAYLLNTRYLVLQYVVVRPLTTFMALIFWGFGVLCPNSNSPTHGQFWVTSLNLLSSTLAVYGLFTFYLDISADIREHKPLWKVIAVKFIVFMCFWGSLILSALVKFNVIKSTQYYSAEAASDMLNAFIICVEMLIAAALHVKAFPYTDFTQLRAGAAPMMRFWPAVRDSLSPRVFWRDVKEAPKEMREQRHRRKERREKRSKLANSLNRGVGKEKDDFGMMVSVRLEDFMTPPPRVASLKEAQLVRPPMRTRWDAEVGSEDDEDDDASSTSSGYSMTSVGNFAKSGRPLYK